MQANQALQKSAPGERTLILRTYGRAHCPAERQLGLQQTIEKFEAPNDSVILTHIVGLSLFQSLRQVGPHPLTRSSPTSSAIEERVNVELYARFVTFLYESDTQSEVMEAIYQMLFHLRR